MYYVSKRMEISAAHCLSLSYDSPCNGEHGHNWIITVHCKASALNDDGMVIDFAQIKTAIHGQLDHTFLNESLDCSNPTSEYIAKWVCDQIDSCYKVEVQESEGNIAVYEVDEDTDEDTADASN